MSDRIQPKHLQRRVLVYIRQSSSHQVLHNEESRRLQYAMAERVRELGWTEVEVIDEDLGRSASSVAGRDGFQRMVAEVGLGHIGAIAAREVSRFARNNRDWHHLIEMCSLVDTLLIDHQAVYDPRSGNDRLLLGVKGSLSEYELDLLRQRAQEARDAKAARGELVVAVPVGFVKSADLGIDKDPDQRVQQAIQSVFEKFFELGTARRTFLWFIDHGLELPVVRRIRGGQEVLWRRPSYRFLLAILKNPTYGGTYAFGKTAVRSQVRDGVVHKQQVAKPFDQWSVLIPGHHEGYISWDQYLRIQRMLENNRSSPTGSAATGAAKGGASLLTGLLRCRRCGRKLVVLYGGTRHRVPRYGCHRGLQDTGEKRCLSVSGRQLDECVAKEVLRVVEPCAVQAALLAAEQRAHGERQVLDRLKVDLQAAQYKADRARRQYDEVDPENRLVAAELEARWNQALERVQQLQARVDTEEAQNAPPATEISAKPLQNLAANLQEVWEDPLTDIRLKKRIVRTVVETVLVDVDDDLNQVDLTIHWKGGVHTTLQLRRHRRGYTPSATAPDVIEAVRVLGRVSSDRVIAAALNRNGITTGQGNRWTSEYVRGLRCRKGIPVYSEARQRSEGWMKLGEAAAYLGITPKTLRRAAERAAIEATHPLPGGPWIFQRAILDQARSQFGRNRTPAGPVTSQQSLFESDV